jgi:uroporphyrinogen-III synthase
MNAPLRGRRIVVTRAEADSRKLAERLEALGAEALFVPAIRIEFADPAALDAALKALTGYHWIIFTSRHAVQAVFRRTGAIPGPRVAAIGPATAAELRAHGVEPDLVPEERVAEALLAALGDVKGFRILMPRADIARRMLVDELRERGAIVDEIVAYHTRGALAPRPALDSVDAVTFTSASTVRGFLEGGPVPPGAAVVCIGPVTARTAREHGLNVTEVAGDYTEDGLVAALIRVLGSSKTSPSPGGRGDRGEG